MYAPSVWALLAIPLIVVVAGVLSWSVGQITAGVARSRPPSDTHRDA